MDWWPVLLLCVAGYSPTSAKCWNGNTYPNMSQFIRNTENYYPVDAELILKGPLYQFGDFSECIYDRQEQYCMTEITILPTNRPSLFWEKTQKISNSIAHFRRDLLHVGVCVPRQCEPSDVKTGFENALKKGASNLGVTVNVTITKNACQTNDPVPAHVADYITLGVIVAILLLVAYGSLYDFLRKRKNPENSAQTFGGQMLECFSLQSNFTRLGALNYSENTKDFTHIQGLRTISMYFVVAGHVLFNGLQGGIKNPEWFEMSFKDFFRTSFFNGTILMATFFCISGYLLGSLFFLEIERIGFFKWPAVIVAILYRYIRLTPVYALIILFATGWLSHLTVGPMHYKLISPEVEACRKNWWIDLLYLHNYIHVDEMCVLHSWYLAADYQCYIVSFIVLTIVYNYRKYDKIILGTALILFGIIVPIQTFYEKLDPAFLSYPENLRNARTYRSFQRSYITFHHNLAPYFIGVMYGYGYYYVKRKAIKPPLLLELTMVFCALVLPWSFMLMGYIFYQPYYTYNAYFAAIYATVHRSLFSCGIGAILVGLSLGYARPIYHFLSWKPFQILGRLTYNVYLVHLYLQITMTDLKRYPQHYSELYIMHSSFSYVVVSNFIALALCLFIEMPSSALPKIIFAPERAKWFLRSRKHIKNIDVESTEKKTEVPGQNGVSPGVNGLGERTRL